MSFVNQTGKTNGLKKKNKIAKEIWLGGQGDLNFVGFSKFSLEISHYYYYQDADLTFFKMEVCWNKYLYKKWVILKGFSFIGYMVYVCVVWWLPLFHRRRSFLQCLVVLLHKKHARSWPFTHAHTFFPWLSVIMGPHMTQETSSTTYTTYMIRPECKKCIQDVWPLPFP